MMDGGHIEPCTRCRGKGVRWIMADGVRSPFQCNTCKGLGTREFKESAEVRAKTRAKAKERKARKLEAKIAEFKAAYPDIWTWMETANMEFAGKMREALLTWGGLTDGQLSASVKLSGRRYPKKFLI